MNAFTKIGIFLAISVSAISIAFVSLAQRDQPREQQESVEEDAPVAAFAEEMKFRHEDGEAIYRSACQACHQEQGEGAVGAGEYPALRGNETLEAPAYPIYIVIHGQRAMPAFGGYLDNEQIAEVVDFIRTEFNDFEPAASAEEVEAAR